jgi:hypothetical protein
MAIKDLREALDGLVDALVVLEEATAERDIVKTKRIIARAKVLMALSNRDAQTAMNGMVDNMKEIEMLAALHAKRGPYKKDKG